MEKDCFLPEFQRHNIMVPVEAKVKLTWRPDLRRTHVQGLPRGPSECYFKGLKKYIVHEFSSLCQKPRNYQRTFGKMG
jgi:hypothetical protein